MALLIAGVVLWSITHLLPSVAPAVRSNLAGKLGEGPYKGLFALDIVIALVLIVYGWKSATAAYVYTPPLFGSPVIHLLMLLALILFAASSAPTNIKRYIRHPQMMAVILWGVAHLLSNGDGRSVTLFGGLTAWAILEMVFINRRDGAWQKPESKPIAADLITVVIGILLFTALLYFHRNLFGVAVLLRY